MPQGAYHISIGKYIAPHSSSLPWKGWQDLCISLFEGRNFVQRDVYKKKITGFYQSYMVKKLQIVSDGVKKFKNGL